jgi:3-oxoacyl-(acyl-carrier-protein) synthase
MSASQTQSRRIVITGLGINTPIGDELDTFYQNLLAGKSAITQWKWHDNPAVYSRIGGDLSQYDAKAKLERLKKTLPRAQAVQ